MADNPLGNLQSKVDTGVVQVGSETRFKWTPPGPAPIAPPGTSVAVRMQNLGLTTGPKQITKSEARKMLSGMSQEDFFQLQQQLYGRGLYESAYYSGDPRPVSWGALGDPDTIQAFVTATNLADYTGDLDQILNGAIDSRLAGGGGGGRGGPTRAPLVIELPSAEDLGAVLKQSATKLLGRNPTSDELAAFVADFQSDSAAYQRESYGKAVSGGTVGQPPTASTAAETFLQEKAPVEAGAQKLEGGLGVLLRMFGGGG
ncbi:MAG: hypothetical protein WAT66_14580 [Actinomycetota bacterium]